MKRELYFVINYQNAADRYGAAKTRRKQCPCRASENAPTAVPTFLIVWSSRTETPGLAIVFWDGPRRKHSMQKGTKRRQTTPGLFWGPLPMSSTLLHGRRQHPIGVSGCTGLMGKGLISFGWPLHRCCLSGLSGIFIFFDGRRNNRMVFATKPHMPYPWPG